MIVRRRGSGADVIVSALHTVRRPDRDLITVVMCTGPAFTKVFVYGYVSAVSARREKIQRREGGEDNSRRIYPVFPVGISPRGDNPAPRPHSVTPFSFRPPKIMKAMQKEENSLEAFVYILVFDFRRC